MNPQVLHFAFFVNKKLYNAYNHVWETFWNLHDLKEWTDEVQRAHIRTLHEQHIDVTQKEQKKYYDAHIKAFMNSNN